MKTIKLYDTDSHIKIFQATVVACLEAKDLPDKLQRFAKAAEESLKKQQAADQEKKAKPAVYALVLDQTAFFAEGGGQAPDRGILYAVRSSDQADDTEKATVAASVNDSATAEDAAVVSESPEPMKVLDVQEQDGVVYHFVAAPAAPGSIVRGAIDWEFRFTNMQQHSGEHILSGICYAWKGYHNVGFHMGKGLTTIDFDGPLTREELAQLERRANEIVYENQPVIVFYPSKEELDAMDYRSKKELTGDVRIVKVGEADLCACCAPHVRKTGEIGIIKIVHAENYKGGVRITIVCGMRAVEDYAAKHDSLERMANLLTTKIENVEPQMGKTLAEQAALNERVAALSKRLIEYKAKELLAEALGADCAACADVAAAGSGDSTEAAKAEDSEEENSNAGATGHVRIAVVERELDNVSGRLLINRILEQASGAAAVLLPKETANEWMFIVGSNTVDLREASKALRTQFGARGGGSKEMIQGTIAGEAETILKAMREIE